MNELATDTEQLVATPVAATSLYVPPPEGFAPMRVLLLVPQAVPAWLARFVELAADGGWLEPLVLPMARATLPTVRRVAMDVRLLLSLERRRKRRVGGVVAGSLDAVDVAALGPVASRPPLDPGLPADELRRRVEALRPDVILLLAHEAWAEPLAGCARHGCWVLDASLGDPVHGGLHLLAPMLESAEATTCALELAGAGGRSRPLESSRGSTQRHSFIEQRELAMRKLPALLARSLRKLAVGGLDVPAHQVATLRPVSARKPFAPGVRAIAVAGRRFLRKRLDRMRGIDEGEPWRVLLRAAGAPIDPAAPVADACRALHPPGGVAWADPCIVEAGDGSRLLFVEEFPSDLAGKGSIVCLQVGADGSAQRLGVALDEPFHLSYPQPFRWEGQWYMTVESGAARRASLYRAEDFPLRWTRAADLVHGRNCVDPTLHRHEGRWYLFANVSEGGASTCDDLFLFVSDTLQGPFLPHPANPVVADVRCARPAGRLFEHGGRLVRPAQNCGPSYGAAISFREVTALSPTRYEERPLGRLAIPAPGVDGCHTYNVVQGLEVLDMRDRNPVRT